MKKFDDKEKEWDYKVNRGHVDYRKFLDESTCPACNIDEKLKGLLMIGMIYDHKKKKFVKKDRVHDTEYCFKWYGGLILTGYRIRKEKKLTNERIEEIVNVSFEKLKELDAKFNSKGGT